MTKLEVFLKELQELCAQYDATISASTWEYTYTYEDYYYKDRPIVIKLKNGETTVVRSITA